MRLNLPTISTVLAFTAVPVMASRCRPSASPPSSLASSLSSVSSAVIPPSSSASSSGSPSASPSASAVPIFCPNLLQNPTFVSSASGDGSIPNWYMSQLPAWGTWHFGSTTDCGTNEGDPSNCYEFAFDHADRQVINYSNDFEYVVPGETYTVSIRYRVLECTGSVNLFITMTGSTSTPAAIYINSSTERNVWLTKTATWMAPTTPSEFYPLGSARLLIYIPGTISTGNIDIQISDVHVSGLTTGACNGP